MAPPNTDTGLTFVTKSNVGPYLNTKTSYEGSAPPPPILVPRSGPIQNPHGDDQRVTRHRAYR